jgi:hypothetical protein
MNMGCWMIGAGELEIIPAPDETLIKEYIKFSKRINPYERMDEHFPNPWFFNEDNKLESTAGKFAEPSVWFDYIKNFFEALGYQLIGEKQMLGECDEGVDFWELCDIQDKKYKKWKERIKSLIE